MKHSSIFKNRWFACLWAAGILWFAYDVAGSAPQAAETGNNEAQTEASPATDATDAEVTQQQEEELKKALDSIG